MADLAFGAASALRARIAVSEAEIAKSIADLAKSEAEAAKSIADIAQKRVQLMADLSSA